MASITNDPSIGCELANGTVPSLGCLTIVVANIIGILIMFLGAVALIVMLWGILQIIISRGDAKALEKGKKTFTYAIIGVVAALFIFIASNIVASFLGIPNPLQNFSVYVSQ